MYIPLHSSSLAKSGVLSVDVPVSQSRREKRFNIYIQVIYLCIYVYIPMYIYISAGVLSVDIPLGLIYIHVYLSFVTSKRQLVGCARPYCITLPVVVLIIRRDVVLQCFLQLRLHHFFHFALHFLHHVLHELCT